jgi:hypothetical protein
MSDLYSPLVILLVFQGVITLIQSVEQLVVACLALRGTAPEHRAPILRALRGLGRAAPVPERANENCSHQRSTTESVNGL